MRNQTTHAFLFILSMSTQVKLIRIAVLAITIVTLCSCQSSFYISTFSFNKQYERRDYPQAIKELNSTNVLKKKKRNKVLYYLNYATLLHLSGNYNESITYFNLADKYISEHNRLSIADAALTVATNSMKTNYRTESFEQIMLHYYQAINYISIKNYEEALVECRKMNEELQKLDDYRKDNGKHYTQDAFGHYVMGILYETISDYNNAFIAYRNALNIYETDYTTLYDTPAPTALKTAVIRAAYATGFVQDAREFEKKYNLTYSPDKTKGHLIAFIEDGNSPVKNERVFNFTQSGKSGLMSYTSDDGSLNIPIILPTGSSESNSIKDVKSITLALPKYDPRTKQMPNNMYQIDGQVKMAAMVENLNKIAPQSLKDRFWRELGTAIVRVGVKQAVSSVVAQKNEWAGLAISITQAITEKADTRHWQTLPAYIHIIDMEIDPGQHNIVLPSGDNVTFSVEKGQTAFVSIKN